MAMPIVSIGMPVYNGEAYVREAIASILEQEFDDFELVISDNASTDNTPEILREIASQDRRVRLFTASVNQGAAWNFNSVLQLSEGRLFKWAGHDDILLPGHLRSCVETFSSNPEDVVLCYPRSYVIDSDGTNRREYEDRMNLQHDRPSARLRHYLHHARLYNFLFGLWDIEALRSTRGLGAYPGADVVLAGELAMSGKFIEIPNRLFCRRLHDEMSWHAAGRYEGFADWFDASRDHKLVFPSWRISLELLKAVQLAKVSSRERRRLHKTVIMDYTMRRKGALVRELLRVPSTLVRTRRDRRSQTS